jgi:hypothetical protein
VPHGREDEEDRLHDFVDGKMGRWENGKMGSSHFSLSLITFLIIYRKNKLQGTGNDNYFTFSKKIMKFVQTMN